MGDKINHILDDQHTNYIQSFNNFMNQFRSEMLEKLETMKRLERERRKNENVHLISAERDFFKQEAIRLNSICKEINLNNEDLAKELKFKNIEVENLAKKWKESESVNKQLLVELERNIEINKNLEIQNYEIRRKNLDEVPPNFTMYNDSNRLNSIERRHKPSQHDFNEDKISENAEISEYDKDLKYLQDNNPTNINSFEQYKSKCLALIENLKNMIKKEKMKYNKNMMINSRYFYKQSQLEKIFNDCVDSVSRSIANRKIMGKISSSKSKDLPSIKSKFNNINEEFLSSDKKQILENFLFNDEVKALILDKMFIKSDGENKMQHNSGFSSCDIKTHYTIKSNNKSKFRFTSSSRLFDNFRCTGNTFYNMKRSKTPYQVNFA